VSPVQKVEDAVSTLLLHAFDSAFAFCRERGQRFFSAFWVRREFLDDIETSKHGNTQWALNQTQDKLIRMCVARPLD
jgi:hypothetical protein